MTPDIRAAIRDNPNVALTVYSKGGHGMKAGFAGLLGDAVPGRVAEFLVCMSDPAARVESPWGYSVLAALPLLLAFMASAHVLNGGGPATRPPWLVWAASVRASWNT